MNIFRKNKIKILQKKKNCQSKLSSLFFYLKMSDLECCCHLGTIVSALLLLKTFGVCDKRPARSILRTTTITIVVMIISIIRCNGLCQRPADYLSLPLPERRRLIAVHLGRFQRGQYWKVTLIRGRPCVWVPPDGRRRRWYRHVRRRLYESRIAVGGVR